MLDNLIWYALDGPHRHWAQSLESTRWYPSNVAPFIAVPTSSIVPDLNSAAARGFLEPAYFVGVLPQTLPEGWHFVERSAILQMVPQERDLTLSDESDIRVLGVSDRPAMLELAKIAFPDYYRARTAELGEYLGIFAEGKLVAMAGERLALKNAQEISAVCTHPAFGGRGYARRLTSALMRRHKERGIDSFLHVSEGNTTARRLYASMGFVARATLAFGKVARFGTTT